MSTCLESLLRSRRIAGACQDARRISIAGRSLSGCERLDVREGKPTAVARGGVRGGPEGSGLGGGGLGGGGLGWWVGLGKLRDVREANNGRRLGIVRVFFEIMLRDGSGKP